MHFKVFQNILTVKQTRYEQTKTVSFITIILKNGCKTMILLCIQHIMTENPSFCERFIRTLKNKIYKYMTCKNVYIDKLDDIANEYNDTYHRKIKMKSIDVKDNTYLNIDKEVNDKDPKFQVVDHVRISK